MKKLFEWLYELFQPRRLGADWQDDKNDYPADSVDEKKLLGVPASEEGDKFVRIKDQGRTNRCTAYALSYVVEVMLAAHAKKNKKGWARVFIDQDELWENQIKRAAVRSNKSYSEMKRIMERGGDYLHNALGALIEKGCHFYRQVGMNKMKYHVTFEGYARADKEGTRKMTALEIMDSVKKMNQKGHPIFTGSMLGSPWANGPEWNVTRRGTGGHAYAQTDTSDHYLFGPNSWDKKWGDSGYWYVHGSRSRDMFGMYFLYGMKVSEVTDYDF